MTVVFMTKMIGSVEDRIVAVSVHMINSSEQLSSSFGLTTVLTPIFLAVFITLHAISPLFAINILSKGFWVSTTVLRNR